MPNIRLWLVAALLATVAGCSTSDPQPARTTAAAPGPVTSVATCAASGPAVIAWQLQPGSPAYAQRLGSRTVQCQSVEDLFRAVTPNAAGNCVLIALASTNPGYDVNAEPAPKPRHVIARIGPSC